MRRTINTNCFTSFFILLLVKLEALKSCKAQTQVNRAIYCLWLKHRAWLDKQAILARQSRQYSSWLKEVCINIELFCCFLYSYCIGKKITKWTLQISRHGNATGSRHVKSWLRVLCSGRWNSLRYTVVLFRKAGWVDPLCRFCRQEVCTLKPPSLN